MSSSNNKTGAKAPLKTSQQYIEEMRANAVWKALPTVNINYDYCYDTGKDVEIEIEIAYHKKDRKFCIEVVRDEEFHDDDIRLDLWEMKELIKTLQEAVKKNTLETSKVKKKMENVK